MLSHPQSTTNIFNFGPELDQIARQVTLILSNESSFFGELQAQNVLLATQITQAIADQNTKIFNLSVLVQAAILGLTNLATVNNQQEIITLLNEIIAYIKPTLGPVKIGLDLTQTATIKQIRPSQPGP